MNHALPMCVFRPRTTWSTKMVISFSSIIVAIRRFIHCAKSGPYREPIRYTASLPTVSSVNWHNGGCCKRAFAAASLSKRFNVSRSDCKSARGNLIATCRSSRSSRARYTTPKHLHNQFLNSELVNSATLQCVHRQIIRRCSSVLLQKASKRCSISCELLARRLPILTCI